MNIHIKHIIILFLLLLNHVTLAQVDFNTIQNLILNGNTEQAKEKIDNSLLGKISQQEKIKLFKTKGDIAKIEGDIDAAYTYWLKSNKLRKLKYPKDDYHLAWNYALLSNYHYEKINTELAVAYADSCSLLIADLNLEQQKEIEIYKIWNILGQSYKQESIGLSIKEVKLIYAKIQEYYKQSISFIKDNSIEGSHLASTYRLLGNSYLDILHQSETKDEYLYNYQQANVFYAKSIEILKKLYGDKHFEIGRVYFVNGLLNFNAKDSIITNHNQLAIHLFDKALKAYDINNGIDKIPNKEDFLMMVSYLTKSYFREYISTNDNCSLDAATKVNEVAIDVWNSINTSFNSRNTNQNLAIYGLIPFEQTIAIEVFKMKANLNFSVEKIFEANQKLKYYDLLKVSYQKKTALASIDIKVLQGRLKKDEIFLDFHSSIATQLVVITKMDKENSEVILIPFPVVKSIEKFNASIYNFDFDLYLKSALKLYNEMIVPCDIDNKNLIICTDAFLYNLPFEALLCSNKNSSKKDYRELDYMLFQNKIQYVLNPQFFRADKSNVLNYNITAFAPNNTDYTELPFSQKIVEQLNEHYDAHIFTGNSATKNQFLNTATSIVHLSGHGEIDSKNALTSQLVFSKSMLSINDVNGFNSPPQLLVLNTCNSALGKVRTGDGVDGFVRAFHAQGVPTTLSNIWEVDDKVSNELLFDFYHKLSQGELSTDALALSQKEWIRNAHSSKMASPYYWAGHKLMGEEIVFEYEKNKTNWFWYILYSILGLTLVFFFFKKKSH